MAGAAIHLTSHKEVGRKWGYDEPLSTEQTESTLIYI